MKRVKMLYMLMIAAILLPLMLFFQGVGAKSEEKIAYITFDDGPTLNTPEIVDTLEKYGAKATFFVLEERIVRYPDFIKKIHYTKNAIGLHGVSHSEAIYQSPDSPLQEMEKANKALVNVLGKGSRLVRVPFGSAYRLTKEQAQILKNHDYVIWDWNVDPRDSVGEIIPERVMANLRLGLEKSKGDAVILLHDRKSTAKMLPYMLEYLKKEGYLMLPLSEGDKAISQLPKG